MKKKFLSIAVATLVLAMSVTPAMAHGHKSKSVYSKTSNYAVCTIESCILTGLHKHNGISYYAHHYGDGHDYHDYCSIADCTISGYHGHDGSYHFGHNANDGHGYHYSKSHH